MMEIRQESWYETYYRQQLEIPTQCYMYLLRLPILSSISSIIILPIRAPPQPAE
jgi:hypothetical protein